jgi:NAD(P)-dependent dehydrogenase (short-subunit alcohol dehydrogenase family)
MVGRLVGKVAQVRGAASGIGYATARTLAAQLGRALDQPAKAMAGRGDVP